MGASGLLRFRFRLIADDCGTNIQSEGELRRYLESKGVVNTPAQAKKEDLLSSVKETYNNAADNVYDTWSDSYTRKWLENHGVLKSRTAKNRDELSDLMARNYYSARDTTYEYWSDNQ